MNEPLLHELRQLVQSVNRIADALCAPHDPRLSQTRVPDVLAKSAAALIRCAGMMATNQYRANIGAQIAYEGDSFFAEADAILADQTSSDDAEDFGRIREIVESILAAEGVCTAATREKLLAVHRLAGGTVNGGQ